MSEDTHTNTEESDEQKKQEHIKGRLKEMGVSPDSERPLKSRWRRLGKYFLVIFVVALAALYAVEFSEKQDEIIDSVVQQDTAIEQAAQPDQPVHVYPRHPPTEQLSAQSPSALSPIDPDAAPRAQFDRPGDISSMPKADTARPDSYPYNYGRTYPYFPNPYWGNYPRYHPAPYGPIYGYPRYAPETYRGAPMGPPVGRYPGPYGYYNGWQR